MIMSIAHPSLRPTERSHFEPRRNFSPFHAGPGTRDAWIAQGEFVITRVSVYLFDGFLGIPGTVELADNASQPLGVGHSVPDLPSDFKLKITGLPRSSGDHISEPISTYVARRRRHTVTHVSGIERVCLHAEGLAEGNYRISYCQEHSKMMDRGSGRGSRKYRQNVQADVNI